ncbi:MAG: alpha-glucosidase C-terminal domain-containing protein, partial [Pyrinomonadaceae bacterium]|nr:alpha-glucosidase C-terminal domain-containing protein [Pyrinomonadaceae bacterium]
RRFWRDWTGAIKREYPNFANLGELYDGNPAMTAFFQGGAKRFDGVDSGFDTVFDFPLMYPIRKAFANGDDLRELPKMLAHDYMYPNPDLLVTFLGLHDMQRFMSEPNASAKGLMLAQTFLMTTRGVPMLYYGDEIGMTGANDPDNRRDFPGGWREDSRDAFTEKGRTIEENQIFNHVKNLTRIRRELEPLRGGKLVNLLSDAQQQYAFARVSKQNSVIVVFNNAKQPATIEFPVDSLNLQNAALVDKMNVSSDLTVENGKMKVTVAGRSASIFTTK